MPLGVPSSFQAGDPYPIYVERGQGSQVWDVDGNQYTDFHGGFGVGVVGHAHPKIVEAITRAASTGHPLRRAHAGDGGAGRGAVPALRARPGALRQLGHRGDDGRHPHRPGRDRPRHGGQDRGLVPRPPRHGDVLGAAQRRVARQPRHVAHHADVGGIPADVAKHTAGRAVQRRGRLRGAAGRARARDRLPHPRARDDEHRHRRARARLPPGRSRTCASATASC